MSMGPVGDISTEDTKTGAATGATGVVETSEADCVRVSVALG